MRDLSNQKEVNPKYHINIIFLSIAILIMQAVDRLFVSESNFLLNSQLFFGRWGNNNIGLIFSSCFIAFIIWVFLRYRPNQWAVFFLLSGAISNLIDRIIYGGVIDYFNISYLPRFNLADLAIILGAIIWVWPFLGSSTKDKK